MTGLYEDHGAIVCRQCADPMRGRTSEVSLSQIRALREAGPIHCDSCGEEWLCFNCCGLGVPYLGCDVCGSNGAEESASSGKVFRTNG